MENINYTEGKYYSGFGTYIGTRITHTTNIQSKKEHLFSTGIYDTGGAVKLKRILIK